MAIPQFNRSRCVVCEIHDGVPTVQGKAQGHYVSGQGGRRMLVLERRLGDRLRINETTQLVILEIGPGRVVLAVEETVAGEKS